MSQPAPFFRTPYNIDLAAHSAAHAIPTIGESLTVQEHAVDCDINVIVARFGITGQMPESVRVPSYGDFTGITDYRSALEAVQLAADSFNELPAAVRSRFENDPQQFLEFCTNPSNSDEARKLGLAIEPKKPDTTLTDVVDAIKAGNVPRETKPAS